VINKNKPLISVIIPTYNRANLLSRAIKSVLNQIFKDFEIIVIDDCSIDNTEEVIKKFQEQDKRIRYIRHEKNKEAAMTRNTGIKVAKGEYIAFLDSDDEWLPEKLEKQFALFRKNEKLGFVSCNALIIDEKSKEGRKYIMPRYKNILEKLLESNFIDSTSSVVIRKDVLNEVGYFDEKIKIGEDWDMWIRIAQKYEFDFVKKPLFRYYLHQNNITKTTSNLRKAKDKERIIEKYKDLYKKYPKAYSEQLRGIGSFYLLSNEKTRARIYLKESIKYNLFSLKNYLNFLCSFFNVSFYKKIIRLRRKLYQ